MEQGQDKLVTCKCCGSDACYESEFTTQEGPITTWMCMTCVHDNLAWFPTVITMPEKGMIFPEPIKGKDDWQWTCVKTVVIPEEEQNKYPDPKNPGTFYKNRMDMKNPLRFDKLCFMDAAEELGMFVKQPV